MSTDDTTNRPPAHIVLVPGLWLGAWAWDEVVAELNDLGTTSTPVTLPGLDPADARRADATLEDQVQALTAVVQQAREESGHPVVLAAHSGANAPASVVLDLHPELVGRMVWVDTGPAPDGWTSPVAAPDDATEVPLPPHEELDQDGALTGLDEPTLARFRDRAVPEPAAIVRGRVTLRNPARRNVPTTMICTSITSSQVAEIARQGVPMMAEVPTLTDLTMVDLPTGHWPMWSRPADLAAELAKAARG